MLSSILLIRGFSYFIFNFWRTKIFSYKFWNNILFSLIFFNKKVKKVKTIILSHVQKIKIIIIIKIVILTTHLYSNVWTICSCYLFEFKYFNHLYKKNAKLLLPKNVKRVILSNVQKKNTNKQTKRYSHHSFVFKCPILISIYYLFVFKYFNYLYQNIYIYIYIYIHTLQNYFKKKKSLPHIITTHSYLEISSF